MVTQPLPAGSPISQEFGANATIYNTGAGHSGRDYAVPEGTPIRAIADGVVLIADWSQNIRGGNDFAAGYDGLLFLKGGGGIVLALDHDFVTSTMSHLSRVDLNPGDRVKEGDIVAWSGNTGTATTGPHVHFEILAKPYQWENGYYGRVHPAPYLEGRLPINKTNTGGSVSKAYQHITAFTTVNQVDRSFYGFGSKPTGITLHHWGNDGQRFDDVCRFLATNTVPTSAHTVIEDGRIATLAVPERATFHAGHGTGNGTTIGIEARPECTPGDVDTVVQYIYELETVYGSLNLFLHQEWFATACPGRWAAKRPEIIERVNAMHKNGGVDPRLSSVSTETKPSTVKPVAPKPAPPKGTTYKAVLPGVKAYTHVPGVKAFHTVQRGQTLNAIAKHYGTTAAWIVKNNADISDPNKIRVGQKIRVR